MKVKMATDCLTCLASSCITCFVTRVLPIPGTPEMSEDEMISTEDFMMNLVGEAGLDELKDNILLRLPADQHRGLEGGQKHLFVPLA